MRPDQPREQLAAALRQHHARLKEILDLIEKRDLTSDQIGDQIEEIADGLKKVRKGTRLAK